MNRNLDGVFFRIKRGEQYENVCFSDLTEAEQDEMMDGKSEGWLKSLCKILAKSLYEIGEQFDIVCGYDD